MNDLLPHVQLDPAGSSDFMYRINRRRQCKSGISSLAINRLSTWSVARIQDITMEAHRTVPGPSSYVCRLELDINTAPEFKSALRKSSLTKLTDELIRLANEIASEGDKP